MTDALDLIAEAQLRQEQAERECAFWKARAEHERNRCKLVIAMMRRASIEPPPLTEDGVPHWKPLENTVREFARVISDPYAAFQDDEDGYQDMTHETVITMLTYRIQDLISAAVKAAKA